MKCTKYSFKNLILIVVAVFGQSCTDNSVKVDEVLFNNGDIIFHESKSGQGRAVQLATASIYSHVGMIFKDKNEWQVIEAVQPVRVIPLEDFVSHGDGKRFVVKRLKESIADSLWVKCIEEAKTYLGKDYDAYFEWSDDRIYCSELIYKVYENSLGIELCKKAKLKDMHLEHPIVQEKLKERYGNSIPMNEDVVSPANIFESGLLKEVIKQDDNFVIFDNSKLYK